MRALAYLPFVFGCAAIWLVSGMEQPPIPEVMLFRFSDKLMHASAYAVLGALAIAGGFWRRRLQFSGCIEGAALASIYGVVDEVHQSFVPGRSATVSDVIADCVGVWLIFLLVRTVLRRRARAEPLNS